MEINIVSAGGVGVRLDLWFPVVNFGSRQLWIPFSFVLLPRRSITYHLSSAEDFYAGWNN